MVENLQLKPTKINFTDQQIIDGLKHSKDENHLRLLENAFYKRYVNYIYHAAINKCRNFSNAEALASDITQETFINAFKAIKNFSFPDAAPEADYGIILKAWLGKIGNNFFRKVYSKQKSEISIEYDSLGMDDVICPICCEVLIEKKGFFVCSKGHYKTETTFKIKSEPLPENLYKFDLFESLYAESDIDIPNEFRTKLQEVMNTIKEEHKHILLTYVEEGCINSTRHLSHKAMSELCTIYKTSSENIRQIKKRTLDKIKKHCFAKNK